MEGNNNNNNNTPVIKKPGLDLADIGSYRPIFNLSVISKLPERIEATQLTDYLKSADILPQLQSGFRSGHSTMTAVLRVLSDIMTAVDGGDVAALVLLDLSAAFDTVDHNILCRRLQTSFGLTGSVLRWFTTYLHGRTQLCPPWSDEVCRHHACVWGPAGLSAAGADLIPALYS